MMFGKHGIFGIGSSWKKVVRQESSRRKVVLTKVTLLRKDSQCEDILSHPALAKTGNPEDNPREQASNHTELSKSGVQSPLLLVKRPSNCTLLTLYKSESEDSGVELPSGTNSPSTPSGSEQSFVVHRRESSCDSGMAMSIISSSPAIQHSPFPGHCPNSERCIKEDQKAEKQCSEEHPQTTEQVKKLPTASEDWRKIKRSNTRFSQRPTIVDEGVNGPRHVSLVEIVIADTNSPPVSNDVMKHEVYRGAAEARLDQESLKRQPSSDSLDKYMEKCCRLSEVREHSVIYH
ncbi:uncharacterized protein [Heptranchias perlo]|uniref:uncharacterized protein n=1 Tax=Heptranchias perlo TaxID=212740 RepID=UPI0035596E70